MCSLSWSVSDGDGRGDDVAALVLWRHTATLLLEGNLTPEGANWPVPAPVPLHAHAILRRVHGNEQSYDTIAKVRDDLAATRDY